MMSEVLSPSGLSLVKTKKIDLEKCVKAAEHYDNSLQNISKNIIFLLFIMCSQLKFLF